jgi:putative aldouronate transport system permease protein
VSKKSPVSKFNQIPRGWDAFFMVILLFVSLFMLVPLALVIIVSFSSESSIALKGYSLIPLEWTMQGYEYLFKVGDQVFASYRITIIHTALGTLMSLFVMTMYSYVIAQRNFIHRKFFTWFLFFTMLFSGGLVPHYIMNVRYLHIDNSLWIFLLPSLVSAYNVIILRTFITSTIPDTLFEAARIDGANHFRIYFSIVLPLFKAGIATIALFNVVGRWNDWFTGMLYVKNPKLIPIQTMLKNIQDNIEFLKQNAEVAGTPDGLQLLNSLPDQNLRMGCTVLVIVPILCAYPFFQRYFVQGLTVGSVKG